MSSAVEKPILDSERAYHGRRGQPVRRRERRGEALLLLLGLTLALLVAEGVVRVGFQTHLAKGGYSPVRGRRSREPQNRAGYRDVEHAAKKPANVRRAVFVGDSFTYGVGVLLDDTYPKRVERTLSTERSETWESIVLAVPGIGTEEEATIVENEALTYSPDVLVLGYVLNDAEDPSSAERRRATEWVGARNKSPGFWRRSALLRLIADRVSATSENETRVRNYLALYQDGAPGFEGVRRSIDRIARACRNRGVPLVVAVFPLFANPLDERYPFEGVHEKITALGQSTGASVVDLLPYYRNLDWRLLVVEGSQDEHPNELAHRIAAQALVRVIESQPALSPSPSAPLK